MAGDAVNAKTLRGETSLLRHWPIRGVGLILGMLLAFLVGGIPGLVALFFFAIAASVVAYVLGRLPDRG